MTRIISKLKSYRYRHFHIGLFICVCALTIVGILAIASATDSNVYEKKQVLGFILGMVIAIFATFIDYKFLLKFSIIIYIINLVLLVWVKVGGSHHMGATRWIDL